MKPTPMSRRGHRARVAVALPALLVALAACSGDGEGDKQQREYTVPKSLCGSPVDSGALAKFLPAGKKVSVEETVSTDRARRCAVSVDGKRVVYTAQEWWNDMSVLNFAQGLTEKKLGHRTDDGRFVYSGSEGFGKTEGCRSSEHAGQVLYTGVQATGSGHEDAAAMKTLIARYTDGVEESTSCQ
ncbi:hypothetical protein [Streptomyces sp. NPDC052225]|uniref:hypothetical protein n=1 Tax=Streptomyces sp. NPDC052225 TaxID=3154949 RepID=UPI0034498A28